MFLVGRLPRHDAGNGRFGTSLRLIVEVSTRNAFDECFLLFRVRQREIRCELPRSGEGLRVGSSLSARPLPGLVTPDPEWPGIRRLRRAFSSEKSFRDVPPAFGKLR